MAPLLENRKARMEYSVVETYEAGLVLSGPEVKMVRTHRGSLVGSHVRVIQGKAIVLNMQIPPYPFARQEEYDPKRTRILLLHKHEILKLQQFQDTKGLSLIPLAVEVRHRRLKLIVAVARGKKQFERREELRRRDIERDTEREMSKKS